MNRLLGFTLLLVVASGCRTTPIVNPQPSQAAGTEAQTREAILAGCRAQDWVPTESGTNRIEATRLVNGKHEMTVAITYSAEDVRMEYVDSRNLDYTRGPDGTEYIHKNYYVWTNQLWHEIKRRIADARLAGS